MKRLILTSLSGIGLVPLDLVAFTFRFVWGPLPSPDKLAIYLAARSDADGPGCHWSDHAGR
jgi:hypothetical protein